MQAIQADIRENKGKREKRQKEEKKKKKQKKRKKHSPLLFLELLSFFVVVYITTELMGLQTKSYKST